ncbi:hypothetical protein SBC1_75390 (plasmid) [Caballeronia sp. SBC1]|nr:MULTISPECIES: universal stress protein [unclassified Caballeronia]QIE30136.1 hypothetical protein SBC2_82120 [Caballeronia sp. SBC2]QIN67492.1 hypothetical protein SBC1_75390 [Caballeronia sp. SBC1]
MFTRILVAVSASSVDTVLESAIEIAQKHDARIFALHLVDPTPWLMGPIDYDFGLVIQALEAQGLELVTRVTDVLDHHSRPAETSMVTLPRSAVSVGRAICLCRRRVGCRPDSSRREEIGLVALAERGRCLGGSAPYEHADSDRLRQSHRRLNASCRYTLGRGAGR